MSEDESTNKREGAEDAENPAPAKKVKGKKGAIYAVAVGRNPGIYLTWAECSAQTQGHSGSSCKKFKTLEEAEAFIEHNKVAPIRARETFYAVANGMRSGVYGTWDEARVQIEGFPGCLHQSFESREAAEDFIRDVEREKQKHAEFLGHFKQLRAAPPKIFKTTRTQDEVQEITVRFAGETGMREAFIELHSVPEAVGFYVKKGFTVFAEPDEDGLLFSIKDISSKLEKLNDE